MGNSSYESHLPPHIRNPKSAGLAQLDPGAVFRIDPAALMAKMGSEREELISERAHVLIESRHCERKIAAWTKLIEAMFELKELGEADFVV